MGARGKATKSRREGPYRAACLHQPIRQTAQRLPIVRTAPVRWIVGPSEVPQEIEESPPNGLVQTVQF